mgnify:CR=1 FL=1|jgi:hypothetical protein
MEVGDVVTWRNRTFERTLEMGILVKKTLLRGHWYVCWITGQYTHKDRVLCNAKHIMKLEEL